MAPCSLRRPPPLLLARPAARAFPRRALLVPVRAVLKAAPSAPSSSAPCSIDDAYYFVPPASAVAAAEREAAAAATASSTTPNTTPLFYGGSPPSDSPLASSDSINHTDPHDQHPSQFWQAVGGLAARAAEAAAPQVVLLPDALPPEAAAAVARECRALRPRLAPELNCIASGRLGCYLSNRSATHAALSDPGLAKKLTRRLRSRLPLVPASYPMELRHYPRGASMPWHSDEALYAEPQWELIYTVDNDSDSETEWRDAAGRLHGAWTPPGSLLCVRAEGWQHRVTGVRRGSRLIVKLCYTVEGATVLPSFAQNLGRAAYDRSGGV